MTPSGLGVGVAAEKFTALPPLPTISGTQWFNVGWRGSVCVVNIFGEIGIGSQSFQELIQAIGTSSALEFSINSVGGCAFSALKIYNATRGRVTVATIRGQCFSAAVFVAASAKVIRIEEGAKMMVHRARLAVFGDEETLAKSLKFIQSTNHFYQKALTDRGCNSEGWFNDSDHYFTAAEALEARLADEIFSDAPTEPTAMITCPNAMETILEAETEDESLFNDFLRAFGTLRVRSRTQFAQAIAAWAFYNTTEKPQ